MQGFAPYVAFSTLSCFPCESCPSASRAHLFMPTSEAARTAGRRCAASTSSHGILSPSVSPGHGVLAPEDWSPVGSAPWGGNATGLISCAGASFLSSQRGFGTERFGFRVPAMPVDAWAPCVGLFHVWDRILTFPSRGDPWAFAAGALCLAYGRWEHCSGSL